MLYQYADSGDSSLVVMAVIALVIFVFMLLVVFIIVRSEGKAKEETGPEHEPKPRLTTGENVRPVAQERLEVEHKARQPAIVESVQKLNWGTCWIISSFVAFSGYDHVQRTILPMFQVPGYYYWSACILAILSPACLAIAWLRLTGVQWRRALVLFLLVPVGAFVIWYIVNVVPYWIAS